MPIQFSIEAIEPSVAASKQAGVSPYVASVKPVVSHGPAQGRSMAGSAQSHPQPHLLPQASLLVPLGAAQLAQLAPIEDEDVMSYNWAISMEPISIQNSYASKIAQSIPVQPQPVIPIQSATSGVVLKREGSTRMMIKKDDKWKSIPPPSTLTLN